MKNFMIYGKEVKISTLRVGGKKSIPTLMDDFGGSRLSRGSNC